MEPCSVLYRRRQHFEPGFDVWSGSSHPRSAAFAVRAEVQVLTGPPSEEKRWEARSREPRFRLSKKTHRVCSTLTAGNRPARSRRCHGGLAWFGEQSCRTKRSTKRSPPTKSAPPNPRQLTSVRSSAFLWASPAIP